MNEFSPFKESYRANSTKTDGKWNFEILSMPEKINESLHLEKGRSKPSGVAQHS